MAAKSTEQEQRDISQPTYTEDEVRQRAYEIFLARNGGEGDELDDWLKAEAELRAKASASRLPIAA
jgi:hypothetical protein